MSRCIFQNTCSCNRLQCIPRRHSPADPISSLITKVMSSDQSSAAGLPASNQPPSPAAPVTTAPGSNLNVVPSYLALLLLFGPIALLSRIVDQATFYEGSRIAFGILSTAFNVYIVAHHLSSPPHPKHRMLPLRKLSIITHVVTGSLEIVTSVVGYLCLRFGTGYSASFPWGYPQAACAFVHVLSAVYQTPIVFGAKVHCANNQATVRDRQHP